MNCSTDTGALVVLKNGLLYTTTGGSSIGPTNTLFMSASGNDRERSPRGRPRFLLDSGGRTTRRVHGKLDGYTYYLPGQAARNP
ncbi:hypothetical protein PsYK624_162960 [Phanerochaete sordida]|uniref:Uncharacterized protein n=1 Tax=Phanerochaete sordida TaxID=48140 RepID=A0A9P3LLR4_9APHY|nr:hypothetical protein PsYK624_162960 [Phanerochaete sordida]